MKLTVFILSALLALNAAGQGDFAKLTPVTPEAAHLQKGVNLPVDISSGIPNISIPLFELRTGNISVPISISYHASGIKVNQLSSSVGLGWGLNAGGAISRNVRGLADEAGPSGWMNNNFTTHFANVTWNGSQSANDYMLDNSNDFSQDDYSYNFLNYGGSFFFDSTKTIRNVMRDPLKLEFLSSYPSKYRAKDFAGFSYYFDSTDYSATTTYPSNGSNTGLPLPSVSSWRLTKIKYQNIDSVMMDYEKYDILYDYVSADVIDANVMFRTCIPGLLGCQICDDNYATTSYHMITANSFKNSVIKNIISRDTKILFYYSMDNSAHIWKKKLDSIQVLSLVDSLVKKRIHFSYSRFSGNDQLKLNAVRMVDVSTGQIEETRFEYYESTSTALPAMSSRSRDMFGYFNGKSNSTLLVSDENSFTVIDADRTVDSNKISLGTLKRVSFKSGGFTEFRYEPNKINDSTYGPGIRVKEVLAYNTVDNVLNRSTYHYYGYHGNTIIYPYSMDPDVQDLTYLRKVFHSDEPGTYRRPLGIVPQGHVYDSVVIRNKSKDYDLLTSHKFDFLIIYNGYKGYPVETAYYRYNTGTSDYSVVKKQKTSYLEINQIENSTPLLGTMKPEKHVLATFTDATVSCWSTTFFTTEYTYTENAVLKSKEQMLTYDGSNILTEETRYYYENSQHLQPTRIVQLNSIDSTIRAIKYPAEMVASSQDPTGVYASMVSDYLWASKISEETFSASSSPLSKTITKYTHTGSFYAPENIQAAYYSNTPEVRKSINSYDGNGNITEYSEDGAKTKLIWGYKNTSLIAKITNANAGQVAFTSFETSETGGWTFNGGNFTTTYSITGNKAFTLNSGNSISKTALTNSAYVVSYWSRNGSLSVNSTSGTAGLSKGGWMYYEHNISPTTSVTISAAASFTIDELRLYPKGAMMNTYCYNPLMGVSSICDINNQILYYEYDGLGRLAITRDIDKNVIRKINYSLSQSGPSSMYYNQEQIGFYNRNNCGLNYEGGAYQYTVSAGRYSSTVSQADANAQAQRELDHLGQQFANLYSTCIYICPNCPGPQKKCINTTCERGFKVYTSSVYNSITGKYDCMYHYEFSDGSWSISIMEESDVPCL